MIDYNTCSDCENWNFLDQECPKTYRRRKSITKACDLFRLYGEKKREEENSIYKFKILNPPKHDCSCDNDCIKTCGNCQC